MTVVERVHHVVWCVQAESLEAVRRMWEGALGLTLVDIDLPERGLHVLLAWDAGIEIIAPTYAEGGGAEAVRAFLADQGEGVYSVVYAVDSVAESSARLMAEGATVTFEETVPPDVVRARRIVAEGDPSFTIRQVQLRSALGSGICLQELVPEEVG